MKAALFIVGLLCLATLTSAGTFLDAKRQRKNAMHLTPQKLASELKATSFGKNVLNLLSLQFKASGEVTELNDLILDLEAKLTTQQNDDDEKYQQDTTNNNNIIDGQTLIITGAEADIQTSEHQIGEDKLNIGQYQINLALNEQEQTNLQGDLDSANRDRARDLASFNKRTDDANELLSGLDKVATLLQGDAGQKLNQDALTNLLGLLQQIAQAFSASLVNDQQLEDQAIQDLQDFTDHATVRLAELADTIQDLGVEISGLEAAITSLEAVIDAQTQTRDNAQVLKDNTVAAQSRLDERYQNDKNLRNQQKQLLASAVQLIGQFPSDVEALLSDE